MNLLIALCVNVLTSNAQVQECKVIEDSREIWVVECQGQQIKLPDYACIYANGSIKKVTVEE